MGIANRRDIYSVSNRRPSPLTIKMVLVDEPKPQVKVRRYPSYAEIPDPIQRSKAILLLHFEGWNKKSLAKYLQVSRPTVHTVLKRFAEEQFAGLPDRSSTPKLPNRKVTLKAMYEVRRQAENLELGAFRVSAALEQLGIKLSPATWGCVLSIVISLRQGMEAFFAALYKAVRASRVLEELISDNGNISPRMRPGRSARSSGSRPCYTLLGIPLVVE